MRSDKAFALLQEAGITDNIDTFRKWVSEGRIKSIGGIFIDDHSLEKFIKDFKNPDKDIIINQLKAKIHMQNNHITGIEALHESTTQHYFKQKEQLNKEILLLKRENQKLQQEIIDLLKENISLRDRIIKLGESNHTQKSDPTSLSIEEKQKLGLSKIASNQEVLSTYKELLRLSHPDRGGNAKLFQYIKADYDLIRKKIKR
ncbi:hypothetical protein R4Z10_05740 [Niallia sp. XMNu-256]|uniref:hypothetical protein n=1 Tax=Niallia sp. XMNu-256 TaxID=3082444 RepID=UPI0030CEE88E